jgi:hypothetical protein
LSGRGWAAAPILIGIVGLAWVSVHPSYNLGGTHQQRVSALARVFFGVASLVCIALGAAALSGAFE